jgi:futalosine hydrolase
VDGPLASEQAEHPAAPEVPPALRAMRGAVVGPLLSVAAASASRAQACSRARRFPGCLAEDMEAHAVLLAASATGKSLVVLRAASNVAGDRDHAGWRIEAALATLRAALERLVETA